MSTKSKILYLTLFLLGFGGLVTADVFAVRAVVANGTPVYMVVLLGIIGLALCMYLGIVLHECGHLVFGLIGKMKFKSITFPLLKIAEVNGRLKLSVLGKRSFLGVCEMFPPIRGNAGKAFAMMAVGGPIGSLVMLIVNALFLALTPYISGYLVVLLGLSAPVTFCVLLENAFPMQVNGARTDGSQVVEILKDTPSARAMVTVLTVQSAYREGYSPAEIEWISLYDLPVLPETDPNYLYLLSAKYMFALDGGHDDLLKDADMRLRALYPQLPDFFAEQILPDIFFNSLYLVPDNAFVVANKDAVFELLAKEDNLTACRIRGYYYVRICDYINAFREIERGRSIAHLFPLEGVRKTELRLIDELEYMIARESKKTMN